jgi:hypothetical protein
MGAWIDASDYRIADMKFSVSRAGIGMTGTRSSVADLPMDMPVHCGSDAAPRCLVDDNPYSVVLGHGGRVVCRRCLDALDDPRGSMATMTEPEAVSRVEPMSGWPDRRIFVPASVVLGFGGLDGETVPGVEPSLYREISAASQTDM